MLEWPTREPRVFPVGCSTDGAGGRAQESKNKRCGGDQTSEFPAYGGGVWELSIAHLSVYKDNDVYL